MQYYFSEGLRRFIQMIFGLSIFEFPLLRKVRSFFYQILFRTGRHLSISNHVIFYRGHHSVATEEIGTVMCGCIKIGEHVSIASDTMIDYSGNVTIGNYVAVAEGCKIFSHAHLLHANRIFCPSNLLVPSKLEIENYVMLGANVIIMPGVKHIGKNAIIMAGSVVTKNVAENCVMRGNPAKKVRDLAEWEIATGKWENING